MGFEEKTWRDVEQIGRPYPKTEDCEGYPLSNCVIGGKGLYWLKLIFLFDIYFRSTFAHIKRPVYISVFTWWLLNLARLDGSPKEVDRTSLRWGRQGPGPSLVEYWREAASCQEERTLYQDIHTEITWHRGLVRLNCLYFLNLNIPNKGSKEYSLSIRNKRERDGWQWTNEER